MKWYANWVLKKWWATRCVKAARQESPPPPTTLGKGTGCPGLAGPWSEGPREEEVRIGRSAGVGLQGMWRSTLTCMWLRLPVVCSIFLLLFLLTDRTSVFFFFFGMTLCPFKTVNLFGSLAATGTSRDLILTFTTYTDASQMRLLGKPLDDWQKELTLGLPWQSGG